MFLTIPVIPEIARSILSSSVPSNKAYSCCGETIFIFLLVFKENRGKCTKCLIH